MNNNIGLFNPVLCSHWFPDEFSRKTKDIWTDVGTLQGWLDIEATLAKVQAELGIIPEEAAIIIQQKADATLFDINKIAEGMRLTLHPLQPTIDQFIEICGEEAGAYVHWGATTQNIVDGGAILQLRASHVLLMQELDKVLIEVAELAEKHKNTLMPGRTHGQQALPITFGLKVAGWHEELRRHFDRLTLAAEDCFMLCMGGAVGTFASMEGKGKIIQDRMAEILNLTSPVVPVRVNCDPIIAYISLLGLMGATFEKIAREIVTLQQSEIDEVEEGFYYGKIGSSTMPQKRNPQLTMVIASMSQQLRLLAGNASVMMIRTNDGFSLQEYTLYQVLPQIALYSTNLVHLTVGVVKTLKINQQKMLDNLALTGGLLLSEAIMLELGRHIGRMPAHKIVYNASINCVAQKITFTQALLDELKDVKLPNTLDLQKLLKPENYIGESVACVTNELKFRHQKVIDN